MMGIFDEDQLYSDPVVTPPPDSALFTAPSSGIGMGEAPRAAARRDLRSEAIANMTGPQKFFGAMGDVGAALQGRPSPLDARIKQQREERASKMQEFRVEVEALKSGVEMAENFMGKTRDDYIEKYARRLDDMSPGSGDTFRVMGQQPDLSKWIIDNAKKIPELALA